VRRTRRRVLAYAAEVVCERVRRAASSATGFPSRRGTPPRRGFCSCLGPSETGVR
jgi:hypothetical protein